MSLLVRNVLVLTLCGGIAACRSDTASDDYNRALYRSQITTTLDAAFACERGYVRAQMRSQQTTQEISDAAIAACDRTISAAVQAYMADVVVRREDTLTAAQVEHERTRARADIIKKLRDDATQLLTEDRTRGQKSP